MRVLTPLRSALEQSLLLRLGLLLGGIATLAVFVIWAATVYLDSAVGRSGAINMSGSLRMATYRLELAASDASPESRARFDEAFADLEHRLRDRSLREALGSDANRALHQALVDRWGEKLGPASVGRRQATDQGSVSWRESDYRALVEEFVALADDLTAGLELELEQRLANLRLIQGLALFMVFVLVLSAMYLIHTQALMPIGDLLEAASALRGKKLDTRVSHDGPDEIGQLGQAFNAMAAELQSGYELLEQRVAEKTADLARSHRQLEVLYQITRTLTEKLPTVDTLREVLETLCVSTGAACAQVRATDPGRVPEGFVVASVRGEACDELLGSHDGRAGEAPLSGEFRVNGATVVRVPLLEGGTRVGTLSLAIRPARPIASWERSLIESVAQHLGAALANARRVRDEQLLGLFEERAVIARELHDSLAQSLSFLKIQVMRIASELDAGRDPRRILGELRTGLNSAYRQLRELLTTFRLRIGDGGFGAALEATTREFASRGDIPISLLSGLPDSALSAAEQIHVLQIVREALANVLHHSGARGATVRLSIDEERQVVVLIEDDGAGIPADFGGDATHHHGLTIMRDRARTLGGDIAFERRPGGGTRVELRFAAATQFAAR